MAPHTITGKLSVFPATLRTPQGQGGIKVTFVSLVPDTWWCQAKINRCLGFLESLEEWGIGLQSGDTIEETWRIWEGFGNCKVLFPRRP